ncbi:molybdate ABC transporter substrate-binding protein [Lacrimispora amygdalina]|jgi:molybdate transport system substrate-binding protein|uniref:molybdate ABC transporter substrate-binding protein n=1 Tax=Lacrimispora amygdalina TaxID=253257 RepID=UPI000BE312B1|nr:molybdate ABC transporter substrate-binding protein [Lacrimispora amygdalina]
MKRGKNMLQVLVAASLMAGILSGCSPAGDKSASGEPVAAVQSTKSGDSESVDVYVFIAASLKNTMDKVKESYESGHPGVTIIYNADSSGTLQKQIEEGAQCDVFFSAAPKQMNALKDGGFVEDGSDTSLLMNRIVLIKPKGEKTAVTGFDNITAASSLALAGEDVPVGQYARKLFTNMGILDQVMKMEINEGTNVTAVLTAVAEGSNEVGVVYATDAASMADKVEIIAEADKAKIDPAVYPVGLIKDQEASEDQKKAAAEFKEYLTQDESVMKLFTDAGFSKYTQ